MISMLAPEETARFFSWVEGFGFLAPALFVTIYVATCLLLIPGSFLTFGAGVLFGWQKGALCVWIGATIGATAAFLIGRYLARNFVERRLERHPVMQDVVDAVSAEGWRAVLVARLCPIIPFRIANYGFGLTTIELRDYLFATLAGTLPSATGFVYLGSAAADLSGIAGTADDSATTKLIALIWIGGTIAFLFFSARTAKRIWRERIVTSGGR